MRLGRGVENARGAVGDGRRHHRGLRPGDAGLVEEHFGAAEPAARKSQAIRVADPDLGAELLEREQVRVDAPPADAIAAGLRKRHLAEPGQQRRREQEGPADAARQRGVEARVAQA